MLRLVLLWLRPALRRRRIRGPRLLFLRRPLVHRLAFIGRRMSRLRASLRWIYLVRHLVCHLTLRPRRRRVLRIRRSRRSRPEALRHRPPASLFSRQRAWRVFCRSICRLFRMRSSCSESACLTS